MSVPIRSIFRRATILRFIFRFLRRVREVQTVYAVQGEDAGKWSSLAFDSDGNAHIAFLVNTDTKSVPKWRLMYVRRDAATEQWSKPIDIGEEVLEFPPSLAVGSDKIPRISYVDAEGKLKCVKRAGQQWDLEGVVATSGTSNLNNSLAIDQKNFPHICYGSLYLVYKFKDATGWSPPITVDSSKPRGCCLRLDSAGKAHISYNFGGTNSITVRYAVIEKGTVAAGYPQTVYNTTAPPLAGHPPRTALALDASDNPHIVVEWQRNLTRWYYTPIPQAGWESDHICFSDLQEGRPVEPSIVVHGDKLKVSYWHHGFYDQIAKKYWGGLLRVSTRPAGSVGNWSHQELDQQGFKGMQGDVGRYSSIGSHLPSKMVMVSYYSREEKVGQQANVPTGHLKVCILRAQQ
jgi:hypothetical protein